MNYVEIDQEKRRNTAFSFLPYALAISTSAFVCELLEFDFFIFAFLNCISNSG